MPLIFKSDELLDQFASWAFGYFPYGGIDFGELLAIAQSAGEKPDDEKFCDAFVAAGDRIQAEAQSTLSAGHKTSARELFLRAACIYGLSYHSLFGYPVHPTLKAAFQKQIAAFNAGLALFDPPIRPLRIPWQNTTLPAYFIPAAGYESQRRPLIILNNGYDAGITDPYFASAVASSRRGYHCLLFDGPGQGELLIEQSIPMRADWEAVVTPVVDFALTLPNVDPRAVILHGWSLGGFLASRAATAEHRLAACVADPGLSNVTGPIQKFAAALGLSASADITALPDATYEQMAKVIAADRKLNWSINCRGFWVMGAKSLRDFIRISAQYTLEDRIGEIRCPTLITAAENDPLSAAASKFHDALKCPKHFIQFKASEGAGDHCEMSNRSLANRRILDWLDTLFPQSVR